MFPLPTVGALDVQLSQEKGDSRQALFANTCKEVAWNEDSMKYLRRGKLEGRPTQMLIDSGCSMSMVSADGISPSKVNTAETVPVLCVHGDVVDYPTAEIELRLRGRPKLPWLLVYQFLCY